MGFRKEFGEFLKKYQVLGLAVAFIMGAAATKLVTSIVTDLIMPIVGIIAPSGDWRSAVLQLGPAKFMIGDFIGNLIDFVIVAIVIFLIVKFIMREDATQKR